MRPSRRHHEGDNEDDEQAEGLLEESNVTMAQEGIAPGGKGHTRIATLSLVSGGIRKRVQ